jgi:2-polyprenyl-3-methyl-5-hydroxy-6-metoxy-1,4-benzoquinol methylase
VSEVPPTGSRRKREWFDDDSFWRDLYPFLFTRERLAASTEHAEKARALARPSGRKALDLGCGPGRCAVPLARLGFSVTGVDRTRLLLARARRAGTKIEWVRADMRDFVRKAAGFGDIGLYGSLEGDPYGIDAQRLVAVARRPPGRTRRSGSRA